VRTGQTRPTSNRSKQVLTSLGLVLANTDDDVLRLLSLAREVVLDDALGAACVASLSIERSTGVMGHHAVTATKDVLSCTQDVVFGCRLDIPNITGVTCRDPSSMCRY
jgi:hypothetical protein